MNKYFLLLILSLINIDKGYAQISEEHLFKPSRNFIVENFNQTIEFYSTNSLLKDNNFIVKDSFFMNFGRLIQKLNELYIFDSQKRKLIFYDGIKCANNTLILKNLALDKIQKANNSSFYDSLFNMLKPISNIDHTEKDYTAIIIWNKSMGIKNDDNFIEWEKILLTKFSNIKVVKINYDSYSEYKEPFKSQIIAMFEGMFKAYYPYSDK